eukprot:s2323_g16.t1
MLEDMTFLSFGAPWYKWQILLWWGLPAQQNLRLEATSPDQLPKSAADKEKNATAASQAVNAAWSVLRDAKSRADYNRGIIDKAIAEENEEKRASNHARQAAAQKRRVEEVATAAAAKRAKTGKHDKDAPGKATSSSSTSAPATSKPGPSSAAPASSSTKSSTPHFEFCKLQAHKTFATCKSTMQKQLQRKFEHKSYAGATHALAVAKEFQTATEKLVTESMGETKLEGLKKFCSDNEIEIPAVTRLTKAFLYDFIEEASQRGALELARLRATYQKSTGVTSTPSGQASATHGVVVDKVTGKFMATYDLGKGQGSLCKIFLCKEDADFWFDTMHSLMLKGRLVGNLAALRKAEATRKATAAAVEKILKENISMESETNKKFTRTESEGKDFFDKIFTQKKASLPPSTVRVYKASLDQILLVAAEHTVEGYILAMWHSTLGWRALTCILTGDTFTEKQVEEFMKASSLVKIGVISSSTSATPPDDAVQRFDKLAKSEKDVLLLHVVKEKHKTSYKTFQIDAKTKKFEEVVMECQVRRAVGETYQVLGTGCQSATETMAAGAKASAT